MEPRDLSTLPKAHLHLHFTGSMRHATLLELAGRDGIHLPDALVAEWPPQLTAQDEKGWFRFQRLYDLARACVRGEADLRRLVHEAATDDAREGSRWLELQVDPTSYAPHVGGIENVVQAEAERLVALGHEVTVLTSAERSSTQVEGGVRVVRVAAWNGLAPRPPFVIVASMATKKEGSTP